MDNLMHNLLQNTIRNTRQRATEQANLRREEEIADNNMRELIRHTIDTVRTNRKKREIHELNKISKRQGDVLTPDNLKSIFHFL